MLYLDLNILESACRVKHTCWNAGVHVPSMVKKSIKIFHFIHTLFFSAPLAQSLK